MRFMIRSGVVGGVDGFSMSLRGCLGVELVAMSLLRLRLGGLLKLLRRGTRFT